MSQYAAFDVSLKHAHGCVVDQDGQVVRVGRVAAEPEAMAAWLAQHAPALVRVGLETGPLAIWQGQVLQRLGVPVVCVDARYARKVLACRPQKTDRNDARGLAELVRLGAYREVRIKREVSVRRRALLLARSRLVAMRRDLENQIRGILKSFGHLVGAAGGVKFAERVQLLVADDPELAALMAPLLRLRAQLSAEADDFARRLVEDARHDPLCRRLTTVPGVGALTALAFVSTVDDIARFREKSAVAAWLGLVPQRYQSGERDYTGRISRAGDRLVRALLFEAAHVLLSRVRRGCALKDWGLRLQRRIGAHKAKVAVARKLAVLLARLWQTGETFRWQAA